MINNRLIYINLIIFGVLSFILIFDKNIDILISSLFYIKNVGFIYKNNFFIISFYYLIPILTKIFFTICTCYLIYLFFKTKNFKIIIASYAFFLVLSAAIGPGLIVNSILKENIGRARPREIIEFGGDKIYSGAARSSNQCYSNCSFSSGHAAMGFYFTVIAYIFQRKFTKIYLYGVLFGILVGISRIIMGGHFASDVIISGFILLFTNHLIYILWQKYRLKI